MTWYDEDGEDSDNQPTSDIESTVQEDVLEDPGRDPDEDASRDPTMESDADDTVGRYTRDKAISFRESREKVQTSREAARSRGKEPEESPFSYSNKYNESTELDQDTTENTADNGSANINDLGVSHEAIREHFKNMGLDDLTTHATGKTQSTEFEFVETVVEEQTIYAILESSSTGVCYQTQLGNYGTNLSVTPVSINTGIIEDTIAGEEKYRKRQKRYQRDLDTVSELSTGQISDMEYSFKKISGEFIGRELRNDKNKQASHRLSVSVIDNYAIVAGTEVTKCVKNVFKQLISEKQMEVVLDVMNEALVETGDVLPTEVKKEIRQLEKSTGGECVFVCRLELYNSSLS